MLRKASESLGADLVIQSSQPIAQKWQLKAQEFGLKTERATSLTTMALLNTGAPEPSFQLIQLKGISSNQPLRGAYATSDEIPFKQLDEHSAWLSPSLFSLHPINQASTITLGTKQFTLAGSLKTQSALNPMQSLAPEVLIELNQLEKIGLIGPGSRVSYRLAVAGDKQRLKAFSQQIERAKQKNPAWQILSAEAPSEDLGNSLDTAWLFLDLSALSAVLVAGMSILIASRFYLSRWKQSIALMRAFGAHNAKMNRLFALQMT